MGKKSNNKTVLLVEDDHFLIEKVKQKIKEKSQKAWSVCSVEEALYYLDDEIEKNGIIIIFLSKG